MCEDGSGIPHSARFWQNCTLGAHLGEKAAADRLMRAIERVTAGRRYHTPDLGGTARTTDVTAAVIDTIHGSHA